MLQFNGFGHRNLKPSFRGCLMQIHQGTPLCHRSTFSLCIFQCHPVEATGLLRVVSHGCIYFRKELMRSYPCWITCFTPFHKVIVYLSPSIPINITSKLPFVSRHLNISPCLLFSLGCFQGLWPQGENQTKTAPKATRYWRRCLRTLQMGTPSLWLVPCFNSCNQEVLVDLRPFFSTCRRTLENHVIQVLTKKNICPLKRSSATYNQMKFHLASFQSWGCLKKLKFFQLVELKNPRVRHDSSHFVHPVQDSSDAATFKTEAFRTYMKIWQFSVCNMQKDYVISLISCNHQHGNLTIPPRVGKKHEKTSSLWCYSGVLQTCVWRTE